MRVYILYVHNIYINIQDEPKWNFHLMNEIKEIGEINLQIFFKSLLSVLN